MDYSSSLFGLLLLLAVVAGCAGGSGANPPGIAVQTRAQSSRLGGPVVKSTAAPLLVCVGSQQYRTVEDDEFSKDTVLNYTNNPISQTPAPNGAIWSSQAAFFVNGRRNNLGIDDAFYTDSQIAPGFNPFTLSGGALNIKTEPIPTPYATASVFQGAHWLSGLLEGPGKTYGYVEVSAKEPNLQGFWPAPLWLLGLAGDDGKGDGYEELDVNELFGNSLGKSVVQQTQIFSPGNLPPRDYERTYVQPDPSTAFHTYGVLWTPSTVSYYIDRVPVTPAYPNAANGPANPIIILQVFASSAFAPPPLNKTPQTMSVQYFRWYQSTGSGCSPSAITTPPPTYPSPTAGPAATPVPGAPVISQDSGVADYPALAPFTATLKSPAKTGDVLVAIIVAGNPITAPTGFSQIDGQIASAGFQIWAGAVGTNGLTPAASYQFGTNGGVIDLLDITGASTSNPGLVAPDQTSQPLNDVIRSLTIPSARGLLISTWAGYSDLQTGFEQIGEKLPAGQTEHLLDYSLHNSLGSNGSFALRISQINGDPFSAPQPYSALGTSSVLGEWQFDGELLWIRPAQ